MNVTAIKPAFYNGRRVRVGDQITVADGYKGSWFTTEAFKPSSESAPEPMALSELNNIARKTFTDVNAPKAVKATKAVKTPKVEAAKVDGDFA